MCLKVVIGCTLLGRHRPATTGQAADWDADGDVDLVVPQGLGRSSARVRMAESLNCIRHIRQLRPHLSKRLVLDQILEPVNFARSGLMYVENVNGSLIFRTRPQPGHPSNFLMPLMILSG